jgi:hypothetical protein
VNAVQAAASAVSDWRSPTSCADWDAAALAGHLLAIARYYHRLLDAAVQGRRLADLPRGRRLQDMNALDLAALPHRSGPKRIAEFVTAALQYGERLADVDWELVLGVWDGVGALQVGQHTGLAVGEWHVHAWDLAHVNGQEHRPNDAEIVVAGRLVLPEPLPAGDPWTATLRRAGASPDSCPQFSGVIVPQPDRRTGPAAGSACGTARRPRRRPGRSGHPVGGARESRTFRDHDMSIPPDPDGSQPLVDQGSGVKAAHM